MDFQEEFSAPEQVIQFLLLEGGGLAHLLHHQVLQNHLALGLLHHSLLYGGMRHQAAGAIINLILIVALH